MYEDELIFDAKPAFKKKKVLSQLDEIDDIILPSSIQSSKKDKSEKEKKKESKEESSGDEEWFSTIKAFQSPKRKKSKKKFKGFGMPDSDDEEGKKKKKKNGDKIDYGKEFAPESAILKNMLAQQTKFTDTLQKDYDTMRGTKSTARGIGKMTTDMIEAINSARTTSLHITKEIINTKKTIADLNAKQRKEFGASDGEGNGADYAASYLQKIIGVGRQNLVGQPSYDYPTDAGLFSSIGDDDIAASLSEALDGHNRDESVNKYLNYENQNVTTKIIRDDDGNWDFATYNEDGEFLPDYPSPSKNVKMNFNMQSGIASDEFGRKYPFIQQ